MPLTGILFSRTPRKSRSDVSRSVRRVALVLVSFSQCTAWKYGDFLLINFALFLEIFSNPLLTLIIIALILDISIALYII